jgi:hypothetical protein
MSVYLTLLRKRYTILSCVLRDVAGCFEFCKGLR